MGMQEGGWSSVRGPGYDVHKGMENGCQSLLHLPLQSTTDWGLTQKKLIFSTVWLVDCCLLPVYILISYKDTSYIVLRSTLVTSFSLNCLFKDSTSKYSHLMRYWGVGVSSSTYAFGGEAIQPITMALPSTR